MDAPVDILGKWWTEETDARLDEETTSDILEFLDEHGAVSIAAHSKLLGCPHEEGVDYPEGESCPDCPYWARKDRWAGIVSQQENG